MKIPAMLSIGFLLIPFFLSCAFAQTVASIPPPDGYVRQPDNPDSYLYYLRSLPLSADEQVKLWDGTKLPKDYYQQFAVIDLPLLYDQDIEQCADFSMRLWAEYLKSINSLDNLALFDFYGRKKPFSKSNKTFREYLRWHMQFSNSYSVKLGAQSINILSEVQAGDMFVQNDSEEGIGHVSVVIDQATNDIGQNIYLVGYSFMPAQQFHIEKSSEQYGPQGWFTAQGYYEYAEHAFGSFGRTKIRRYEKY